MFGFPGDRFMETDETAGGTGDSLFPGMGHRLPVELDASGKVKDPLGRGGDEGRQVNRGHFLIDRCWIIGSRPSSQKKSFQNLIGSAKGELDHSGGKELIPDLDADLAVDRSEQRTQ